MVRTLADRLPQHHLVEFDGIGHMGTMSAPRQVADAVRSFCLKASSQP
jgi:pimeloyl-ACP methyl ester carboxylesterase